MGKEIMMKPVKTLAALAASACLLFAGCTAEEKKEPVQTDLVLGIESEDGVTVVLANESETTFTSVQVRMLSQKEFGSNLLKEGVTFENGKTAALYLPAAEPASSDDKADKETAALLFATEDKAWQFDDFAYYDVKDQAVLKMNGDTLELSYESSADNKPVSLKTEAEALQKEEEPEKEPDEAETESVKDEPETQVEYPEETPAAEPVYEEPVYEEPVYQEPVYEEPSYQEPVYEEPVYTPPVEEAPSQGSEGCLGPGFFD